MNTAAFLYLTGCHARISSSSFWAGFHYRYDRTRSRHDAKTLSCRSLRDAQKICIIWLRIIRPLNCCSSALAFYYWSLLRRCSWNFLVVTISCLCLLLKGIWEKECWFYSQSEAAAAFSNSDSALTAMTTSFCIDLTRQERHRRNSP